MNDVIADRHKEQVRTHALALGFAACGFTDAEPLACGPLLAGWLASNRHGSMDYLARDVSRRLDPRSIVASATSVIVLAWRYDGSRPARADWRSALTGRIAAYAFGRDYHDALTERTSAVGAFVADIAGGSVHVQVDAGPLVEKELARRAGLGWYGHNTNLLTRGAGSYVLLACLITEARFEPDKPFADDHCGTCRACIPACPTDALSDGPTIDARRCISYLTIEHRGPIDPLLRAYIGNWVFGCDACQDVCPWNAHSDVVTEAELEPYLPDLLRMSEEEFRFRFTASAVARAKRRGLARNAAVALGNTGNPEAVEPLALALERHEEPLVRAHAAWALGRLDTPAAGPPLRAAARREQVPPVLREVETAVARLARRGRRGLRDH